MPFKLPPVFIRVAIPCAGLGLLFQIIGLATEEWIVIESGLFNYKETSGLWYDCGTNCFPFLNAVRAFGIIGLLVLAGCLVVGILMCFMDNDKFILIGPSLGFVAAFCIMIEFAVYADHVKTLGGISKYGYSFAMTVVAFVLAAAAGAFFFLARQFPNGLDLKLFLKV